jgi:hypothetical protein
MQTLRIIEVAKERIEPLEPASVGIVVTGKEVLLTDAAVELLVAVKQIGLGE